MNTEQSMIDASNSIANNFSFQAATHNLEEFDGKNRSLKDFIQDIESGNELVPEALKKNYVKFVLSRLRGVARDCFLSKTPANIQDIVDVLLEYFAPGKSYANYIKEIQAIRIHRDETVSEFYTRLLNLIHLAKAALKAKYKNEAAALEPQLDDIALSAFKEGVSDRMSYALTILDNLDTLEKAYKKAKCIESAQKNNSSNPLTPSNNHIYAIQGNDNNVSKQNSPSTSATGEPVVMDFHSSQNYNRNSLKSSMPQHNAYYQYNSENRPRSPSPGRYEHPNSNFQKGIMKYPTQDHNEQRQNSFCNCCHPNCNSFNRYSNQCYQRCCNSHFSPQYSHCSHSYVPQNQCSQFYNPQGYYMNPSPCCLPHNHYSAEKGQNFQRSSSPGRYQGNFP